MAMKKICRVLLDNLESWIGANLCCQGYPTWDKDDRVLQAKYVEEVRCRNSKYGCFGLF